MNQASKNNDDTDKPEELEKVVTHLLEECRMLLPGIQAIFGFQLIAVFQNVYQTRLDPEQQHQHLLALVLVAMAMGLVLGPAAYHRQVEPQNISSRFVTYGTMLVTAALVLFLIAVALDATIIARLSGLDSGPAIGLGWTVLGFFVGLWFVIPWLVRLRHSLRRRRRNAQDRLS